MTDIEARIYAYLGCTRDSMSAETVAAIQEMARALGKQAPLVASQVVGEPNKIIETMARALAKSSSLDPDTWWSVFVPKAIAALRAIIPQKLVEDMRAGDNYGGAQAQKRAEAMSVEFVRDLIDAMESAQ